MFVAEIYIPVLQTLSREIGNIDIYEDHATFDEVPAPPPNTPEITLKANQVSRILGLVWKRDCSLFISRCSEGTLSYKPHQVGYCV